MENRAKTARTCLTASLVLLAILSPSAHAGFYLACENANPLPVQWRGYLIDLRAIRMAAGRARSPLQDLYSNTISRIEKSTSPSADDLAELGGCYTRIGKSAEALGALRKAARQYPENFRIQAHLVLAHVALGELGRAVEIQTELLELTPKQHLAAEELTLKFLSARAKRTKTAEDLDALYDTRNGWPKEALAQLQQLCFCWPSDAFLLWQLAEATASSGDLQTAARLMEGCVTDLAINSKPARERHKELQKEVDRLEKAEQHASTTTTLVFASVRLLPKKFDANTLPKVSKEKSNTLPWAALDDTTIGKKFSVTVIDFVKQLDGQPVSLSGFVQPIRLDEFSEFIVTEYAVGCWFCDTPSLTQQVVVQLKDGTVTTNTRELVTITGTWKLNTTDPEQPLFSILNAKVKAVE
jgi:tetratricopeptide (TPR) repeat protein